MQATTTVSAAAERRVEKRDWVAWYDGLATAERRELRNRLVDASYEDVKAEAELRQFFFFHSEDVVAEGPPGSERLQQLHTILQAMRGAEEPEAVEKRRKALGFLLAEYQRFLRDNPWAC